MKITKVSKRQEDEQGYWLIEDNPISKSGLFKYFGKNIHTDLDPNEVYTVSRPDETFDDKLIERTKLIPIIDDHTMMGDNGVPAEQVGVHGVVGEKIYFKDGVLYANLKIFSSSLMNKIKKGKIELSLGFSEVKTILHDKNLGYNYDATQTELVPNHLALVDKGRMGAEISVLDEKNKRIEEMEEIDKLKEQMGGFTTALAELTAIVKELQTPTVEDKKEPETTKAEDTKEVEVEAMDANDIQLIADNAVKAFEAKQDIYNRVSNVIGAFDCKDMDSQAIANHYLATAKITAEDGMDLVAFAKGILSVNVPTVEIKKENTKVSGDILATIRGE